MEFLIFALLIGAHVLLAAHMVDYVIESTRRPVGALRGGSAYEETPNGDAAMPLDIVSQYNRAA